MTSQRKYKAAYDAVHRALVNAQKDRELRYDPVSGELGWVVYERLVVWGEVNRLRAQYERAPIPINAILVVESGANGHVDYTHKFALRAADLVFTEAKPL